MSRTTRLCLLLALAMIAAVAAAVMVGETTLSGAQYAAAFGDPASGPGEVLWQVRAPRAVCALVVGATFPQEIAKVRERVGDMPLLIPGIGAQGGDIPATVAAGLNSEGTGMMINSSRAILYASGDDDWREAAARVARGTRDAINAAR